MVAVSSVRQLSDKLRGGGGGGGGGKRVDVLGSVRHQVTSCQSTSLHPAACATYAALHSRSTRGRYR